MRPLLTLLAWLAAGLAVTAIAGKALEVAAVRP